MVIHFFKGCTQAANLQGGPHRTANRKCTLNDTYAVVPTFLCHDLQVLHALDTP